MSSRSLGLLTAKLRMKNRISDLGLLLDRGRTQDQIRNTSRRVDLTLLHHIACRLRGQYLFLDRLWTRIWETGGQAQ